MSVLVDTSVWIDLFRGRQKVDFDRMLSFVICPPIVQEILQGLANDRNFEIIKSGIMAIPCVAPNVGISTYLHAADIYRTGRSRGYTIRSSIDCLVAAIAIECNLVVMHRDRDYKIIAKYTKLRESVTRN